MKTLTLEEIDNKSKELDNFLNQLSLEKKKVIRKENELFEMHRQSLLPLRQILELPLSSKDYQTYQDLIMDIGSVGALVEAWSEERKDSIKKQEDRLERELDELCHARKKLMIEQESNK